MPARYGLFICLLLVACGATLAAEVGPVAALDTPSLIFTGQAGVVSRQEGQVALAAGENRFLFDFGRYDLDPATLELRILKPAEGVQVVGRQFPPRQPGQVVFLLQARQATDCRVRLSFAVKGLAAEVSYTAVLAPEQQTLTLRAQVVAHNDGKLPLPQTQITLPTGHRLTTGLDLGQSVQQELLRYDNVPYQVGYLYDNSRFKDSVRAILKLARSGSGDFDRLPLPEGKLTAFAASAGGVPTFIADSAVKYTPAHEKLDLDLGIVPEITVLRTKVRSDQVNVRTDVYKKVAMFDLLEEYEFEVENHRPGPVTIAFQEHFPGEWQIIKASVPYQKLDAGTVELTLKLDAGQKTKLDYVVKRLNVEP
jgi:hypothetical protein